MVSDLGKVDVLGPWKSKIRGLQKSINLVLSTGFEIALKTLISLMFTL